VCATETLLSPHECENLGSIPGIIKEEILDFKMKNYRSSMSSSNGNSSSSCKQKAKLESEDNLSVIDAHTNAELELNLKHIDLRMKISELKGEDIFCRIFKMGFGKGKKNPVTDSTSFYRPNKNQETGEDVTYAEGIVHPSKKRVVLFLA
jgi:hypothetical protein